MYHVVWPVLGTTGDVAASFGIRLTHYPPASKKIILFDRYDQEAPSAKDHERTRRGRAKEVHQTHPFHAEKLFSTIPRTRICSTAFYAAIPFHTTFHLSTSWTVLLPMMRQTLCNYMLKAVAEGAQTIRILSDDTDVLVLLVYWTSRMRVAAKIQMEKWNGDVLDINETEIGIPGLDQVLGQPGATHTQLQETASTFFLPLYGQKSCTTMNDAHAHFYRGRK